MCCRLDIQPLDRETALAILLTGLFVPSPTFPQRYQREVTEEGTLVYASMDDDRLSLSVHPSITHYDHHHGKRLAAGIYFEIAAKYAEKVGGTIHQHANVLGCRQGDSSLILASYPSHPLLWQNVCAGLRELVVQPLS